MTWLIYAEVGGRSKRDEKLEGREREWGREKALGGDCYTVDENTVSEGKEGQKNRVIDGLFS